MKRMLKNKWITKNSKDRLYNLPIPLIGLTGGIASGKSTIAERLRNDQHPILDADQLVKNIYKTPEAISFITHHFPSVMENNTINFKALREIFFNDLKAKSIVEEFIYSRLPQMFMREYQKLEKPDYLFYDVPLLFEKKLHEKVDMSVCVYLENSIQIQRLMKRDQISFDLAQKIISKQHSLDLKKDLADYTIINNHSQIELEVEYQKFILELFN